jgi:hypothetical protein
VRRALVVEDKINADGNVMSVATRLTLHDLPDGRGELFGCRCFHSM